MRKYKKKPLIIESMEILRDDFHFISHWMKVSKTQEIVFQSTSDGSDFKAIIRTFKGDIENKYANGDVDRTTGSEGDYIIRGIDGEFYICKRKVFDATYYEVDSALRRTNITPRGMSNGKR